MKKTGFILMFALLMALPLSAGAPTDETFFPISTGTAWTYRTIHKETKETFDMNVVIEGPWKDGGTSGVIMTQKDKRGKMRQFLTENEKGVFMVKLGLSKSYTPEVTTHFAPAVPYMIFPLVPGTKIHWEGLLKIAWVDKPIVYDGQVVGWEEIEVPAGKFHCIRVYFHEKRGEEVIDETAWYASGVGQVKYDGGQYIKELKSYKADKP